MKKGVAFFRLIIVILTFLGLSSQNGISPSAPGPCSDDLGDTVSLDTLTSSPSVYPASIRPRIGPRSILSALSSAAHRHSMAGNSSSTPVAASDHLTSHHHHGGQPHRHRLVSA